MTLIGYDLGGSENPYGFGKFTVIDPQEIQADTLEYFPLPIDHIVRSIRDPNWTVGLEKRPFIYLGRVLRYMSGIGDYQDPMDSKAHYKSEGSQYRQVIQNLAKQVYNEVWSGEGWIKIHDHLDVIDPFIQELGCLDANLRIEIELVMCDDDIQDDGSVGYPSEWKVTIRKA